MKADVFRYFPLNLLVCYLPEEKLSPRAGAIVQWYLHCKKLTSIESLVAHMVPKSSRDLYIEYRAGSKP